MKVCLVAFYSLYDDNPDDNRLTRLSDLLGIFKVLAEEIFLVTEVSPTSALSDGRLHIIPVKFFGRRRPIVLKALKELAVQLAISWHLLKVLRRVDCIYWGINASMLIMPMLLAKLTRKKSILFIGASHAEITGSTRGRGITGFRNSVLSHIVKLLENSCYSLADIIVVNSTHLLGEPWLINYKGKTFPISCPIRFIDTGLFKISKPLKQRAKQIGYVGRLSEEKGVANFIRAAPLVLDRQRDAEFTVIGDGPQQKEIREMAEAESLSRKIKLSRWVAHAELPRYLNEMQLLVLPSFTEGLPTVALEAMACGTPVLATSVGGVPELIKDGETGFILEDNSPRVIAKGIVRALTYPRLDQIIRNAQTLIEEEYTYEATTARYRNLFASFNQRGR